MMNGKRNKKDSGPTSNNNYKTKSKNINTEDDITSGNNSVKKQKKRETVNMASNENNKGEPVKVGRKRKQHDSDVDFPTAKKSRKKVKEQTSLNTTSTQDIGPPGTNNSFDLKKEGTNETLLPKKIKKKTQITSDQPSYPAADQNNINILETSLQKSSKRKNKSNHTPNVSVDGTNSSFHDANSLGSTNEAFPMQYIKTDMDDIDIKEESFGSDNIVTLTVRDLESDSELTDTEFKCFNKKLEKKVQPSEPLKDSKTITWPEEDLKILVDRMETCIPQNDSLAFSTRAEKLQWDIIAFKNYTMEECKNTWFLLQKQIRKFRLLKEVLADAKDWINVPLKGPKKKILRHPDMPRKPLSAYIIYFLKKKDVLHKAHPGLDATEITKILSQEFKSLSHEKRMKYENLAATKKVEYEQKLNEFYQTHPDIPRMVKKPRIRKKKTPKVPKLAKPIKEKPAPKPPKERIPKRPPPPFQYYYLSEVKTQKETGLEANKIEFKELCKERWKQLPDKKKLSYINFAEAEYAKYEQELKIYMQNHPDYVHKDQKPILTKEDILLKERVAGKPSKPPGSAYNLFARMLLQSDEIKSVPVRDRLIFVSNQWKNCAEEEKKQYKDLSTKLNEKYKLDFASYLETLTEEERKQELQKSLPKRRKSEDVPKKKKGRPSLKKKISLKTSERKTVTKKLVEPEQPPISAFKYFATLYTGEEPAAQAWKALTSEQKKIYEDELVKKKQAYIVDFEKFLKSLTKEELEAFSNSRRKMKNSDDDEADDDEEESSDESGTEESDADSNDENEESDN